MKRFLFFFFILVQSIVLAPPFSADDLLVRMAKERSSFHELVFIRQMLDELKIRGWLLGGSTYSYGNFIRDLMLAENSGEALPDAFQKDANGYFRLRNMIRTSQDIDLVIDGSESDKEILEHYLKDQYPYRLARFLESPNSAAGDSAWEVRLLKEEAGHKIALFNNPEFLNIHNDSGSTGIFEITDPPKGEPYVRDLLDWENTGNAFVQNLHGGTLQYFYNENHNATKRAQKGKNPELFSVIRYLTKAFHRNLEIPDTEWRIQQRIVDKFRGVWELHVPYGVDRLRRLAIKMLVNAADIETAWKFIDGVGLRKKLKEIGGEGKYSLSHWMSKRPLFSRALGQAVGEDSKTAQELGLTEVFFPIREPWEYECLLHALPGRANVFSDHKIQQRKSVLHAVFVALKDRSTEDQLWVRMQLNPSARLNSDFFIHPEGLSVVNKNALTVPRESLTRTVSELESREKRPQPQVIPIVLPPPHPPRHRAFPESPTNYFSPQAENLLRGLEAALSEGDANLAVLAFVENIVKELRAESISRRDFRRLLARSIGQAEPNDGFLSVFASLVAASPEIQEAFTRNRGVFTESLQADGPYVRNMFLRIESHLKNCAKEVVH